jgi:hypothetical protein
VVLCVMWGDIRGCGSLKAEMKQQLPTNGKSNFLSGLLVSLGWHFLPREVVTEWVLVCWWSGALGSWTAGPGHHLCGPLIGASSLFF